MTNIYFFLGKGGVGKTTISSAWAAGLAKIGRKTLLVSLDPAHTLSDALKVGVTGRIKRISDSLDATEIDIDQMIQDYLQDVSTTMKSTYRYLSTLNIDRYFNILKNSPGVEEYAILEGIKEFVSKDEYDIIVFDTPPAGMMVRVLGMPRVSLVWTESLIAMRRKILSRRRMIENVQGRFEADVGGEKVVLTSEEKEDPVMQELVSYKNEMEALRNLFSSQSCKVSIVTMAEELALSETERIIGALKEFYIPVEKVYLNKYMRIENPPEEIIGKIEEQGSVVMRMKEELKGIDIIEIPMLRSSPRGVEVLLALYRDYLKEGEKV